MSTDTPVPHRGAFPSWQPVLFAFFVVLVLSGIVSLAVVTIGGSDSAVVPVFAAALSSVLSGTSAALTRAVQMMRHYRRAAAAINSQMVGLADETLPQLADRVRAGESAEAAAAEITNPLSPPHRRVIKAMSKELAAAERMRGAALATCATAAGRVQALTTSMLADLRKMEDRHSDADVLADLLTLDHSTAQAGRLADSIAVLTGARSGRRWSKPISVESVLRGAMARISDYRRLRVERAGDKAVVGYAAEGVIHALAEIMDNATKFSPPAEDVQVHVDESEAGLVITVEDGGLTMSESALARAERAVSAEPLDLAEVSGSRLGLAVVGCLARKHELTVVFRGSARGGTAVVLTVPPKLVTEPRPDPDPRPEPSPESDEGSPDPEPAEPDEQPSASGSDDPDALPKRRRGKTLRAAPAKSNRDDRPGAGSRFGAFVGGRRSSSSDDQPR
ncbi:sensor histidine kinase [Saccharopolyspora griseoalba]|uniref:histidine kinase n=1 Tax=Saccharopolyspora griseoalba TaxID=1431848 RepID=A0ABW2LQ80_9PSEU